MGLDGAGLPQHRAAAEGRKINSVAVVFISSKKPSSDV